MRSSTACFYITLAATLLLAAGTVALCFAEHESPLGKRPEGFETVDAKSETEERKAKTDELESIIEGFDEEPEPVKKTGEEKKPSRFSLDGYVKHGLSYNFSHQSPEPGETDWRGLSRFRPEIKLKLKAKFSDSIRAQVSGKAYYDAVFVIRGRDGYTEEVLNNREKDAELAESYILGKLTDNLDFRSGRQIIVWGKSDNIRITDVLNPLDIREPGLVDIEDLRLPVFATKLDYYWGDWSLSGIFLHEIRFNKTPAFGSDFFPGNKPQPPEAIPADSLGNTEYAAAVSGILTGWDIAFYFADVYDDLPYQELKPNGEKELKHARLKMLGTAFNIALGNWLLKAETAFLDGFRFFNTPDESYCRLDALAGFEYTGFNETTVSFEMANRHLFDFDKSLKQPPDRATEDEFQTAFRLTRQFLNDTLTLTFLAQTFDLSGEGGAFQRLSARYDWSDSIELSGGLIFYSAGHLRQFHGIGDKDRIFLEIKYSF
ncbi:MAG: hypothetical protein JRH18_07940 [Deltaproteobacteria bacterium]|nr:hypothetical protein [Deltaproteobacteria bacterium]MBW1960844.1 hypothetical protein [Deltaproteobacteria bacterium]MBW2151582.1 hypothetical protein [Deltaproteobacteria bacterium]